jgi:type II secretory pathway pseudopilin PulG
MKIYIKKQKGSAIAYALVVIAFVAIILSSIIGFVVSQVNVAKYVEAKEQAFQVAEAGIYNYRWYLAHQTDGKTDEEISEFWNDTVTPPRGVNEPYVQDYDNLGTWSVTVTKPDAGSSYVKVVSEGTSIRMPNIKRTIEVRMRRSTWTDYAVLTDDPARYDSRWDINGKIMSNKGVQFDGIARNVVYSGVETYTDPDLGVIKPGVWTSWPVDPITHMEFNSTLGENVFQYGKRFPVVQKDFIGVALNFNTIKTYAKDRLAGNGCTPTGCYFDNQGLGRYIQLKTDGTFSIGIVDQIQNGDQIKKILPGSTQTYNIPNNGAIFVESNLWIVGTLNNKRVSVVAGGVGSKIYIGKDHLVYNEKNQSTVLGLISASNIELTSDGPDDLRINASMLAQNGAVVKKDYNPNCCGGGCEVNKNSIDIFGSIASKQRISFSIQKKCNNEKAVGFQKKKLVYDANLYYFPPPFFPSEVFYSIDLWQEK